MLNGIGLVAALATFFGVWAGHVLVRKIEFSARSLTPPTIMAVIVGVSLEVIALSSDNVSLSGACGIVGMTALFDAFELRRQYRRVKTGHAPANPNNPRHADLLASGKATTINWLKREPIGQDAGMGLPAYGYREHHV